MEQLGEKLSSNAVINRCGYILVHIKTNNVFFSVFFSNTYDVFIKKKYNVYTVFPFFYFKLE